MALNYFSTDIDEVKLKETEYEIFNHNGKNVFLKALDIRSYEEVKNFADIIHDNFGSMDIVMNIAGIAIWGEVGKMSHEDWKKIIDVNLMGPIHIIEMFHSSYDGEKKWRKSCECIFSSWDFLVYLGMELIVQVNLD